MKVRYIRIKEKREVEEILNEFQVEIDAALKKSMHPREALVALLERDQ